ncbi:hypothetical protein KRR40_25005 [Niabella defluvii]|nr:hypothetical protein KRR40_25005 [Niabella sp. I65]
MAHGEQQGRDHEKGLYRCSRKNIKRRLKAEGFLFGEDSTFTNVYDSELADAVNELKKPMATSRMVPPAKPF